MCPAKNMTYTALVLEAHDLEARLDDGAPDADALVERLIEVSAEIASRPLLAA